MNKVFLVIEGNYPEIRGVFSSQDKATEFIALLNEVEPNTRVSIEEYTIDSELPLMQLRAL
jgi:hypothetical protein